MTEMRTKRPWIALLAVALMMFGAAIAGAAVTDPYEALYEYTRPLAKADLDYTLARDGDDYVISTSLKAKGAAKLVRSKPVTEESRFSVDGGVIVPLGYERQDGTSSGEDNASVEFDWERNVAIASSNGNTQEFPVARGDAYDVLTAELAARVAFSGGARETGFDVIEATKRVRYTYRLEDTETLTIGKRSYDTVRCRLDRQSKRVIYYWFAPEMDYLLVKMEQRAGEEVKGTITLQSAK